MIELKTPAEIERKRTTGQFVAQLLSEVGELADVGVNLLDLEHHVRGRIRERGAQSCYWDYARPSATTRSATSSACRPTTRCPTDCRTTTRCATGTSSPWISRSGSTAGSRTPPEPSSWAPRPTRTCDWSAPNEEALEAGIEAARPGNRLGDVSAAIEAVATDYGYPVNTEFGGHGLGGPCTRTPTCPTRAAPGRGLELRPGMTLALEPWLARTTDRIVIDSDGWTIRSADGSRTAHSEHTVAVTEGGPQVLTQHLPRHTDSALARSQA